MPPAMTSESSQNLPDSQMYSDNECACLCSQCVSAHSVCVAPQILANRVKSSQCGQIEFSKNKKNGACVCVSVSVSPLKTIFLQAVD